MTPPGEQWIFEPAVEGTQSGLSSDFRSVLWLMRPLSQPDEYWTDHSERDGVYVRRPDGTFSLIAPNPGTPRPRVYATTPDLSHVVLSSEYCCRGPNLYQAIDGDQVLRPVGVDNAGVPLPGASGLCSLGISDDGRVIFFGVGDVAGCVKPLRARVGDATTIDMSASQCTRGAGDPGGVCNADAQVDLAGFARDGSRAFMTTTQQLVNGDTDASNDLYVCEIPAGVIAAEGPVNECPNLRQLSAGADVEGTPRVSADGSHVYFVAHGVLAANRGANDQTAVAGAHNLYVWQTDAEHPEGHMTFLARLTANDVAGNSATQTTPDGRYLVVTTTTPLVTSGPGADTDGADDVYRYDSKTGQWLRLSTDTTGSGGNTERSTLVWFRNALTDDGQTVVFTADEALAPADSNSGPDVYAWHEGQVSLISPDGGGDPGISASGTDIYFTTDDQVTVADGDTSLDVYSARVGGGFDLRESGPCEGEGCVGTPSAPPGLASGVGGLGGQGDVREPAPGLTLRAISVAQRRGLAQSGRVTVTVTASKPGSVSARVTTRIAGKSSNGAVARETMAEAGSVQLTLGLSKKARARLVSKRRLSVKIVVTHSKFALPRSVTLKLMLAAKTKKAARGSSAGRSSDRQGGRS
jgi:Tol biopolymer transport system component